MLLVTTDMPNLDSLRTDIPLFQVTAKALREVRELEARTRASAEWAESKGEHGLPGPVSDKLGGLRKQLATKDAELIAMKAERDDAQARYQKQCDMVMELQQGALVAKQVSLERDEMRQMLKDKQAEVAALQHEMMRGERHGPANAMSPVASDSLSAHMQVALRDLTTEKNAEIVELQKQVMSKDAQLVAQTTACDRMSIEHEAMKAELVSVKRLLESREFDRGSALSEVEKLREEYKASQSEVSELQVESMSLKYELEEHRRNAHIAATTLCKECQVKDRDLLEKEKAYVELERLLHTQQSTVDVIKNSAREVQAEGDRKYLVLECDMESVKRELQETQSALINTKERLEVAQGEIATLQQSHTRASAAAAKTEAKEEELVQVISELNQAKQSLQVIAAEKSEAVQTVEHLKGEIEDLKRRGGLNQMGDHELIEECDQLRKQLDAAQAEQKRLMRMVLNGVDSAISTVGPSTIQRSQTGVTPRESIVKTVRRKSLVPVQAAAAMPTFGGGE